MPIGRLRVGTAVTSAAPISTEPRSGLSRPATHLKSVVLPHPDGPTNANNSPSHTSTETWSRALTWPYILVTPTRLTPLIRDLLRVWRPHRRRVAAGRFD